MSIGKTLTIIFITVLIVVGGFLVWIKINQPINQPVAEDSPIGDIPSDNSSQPQVEEEKNNSPAPQPPQSPSATYESYKSINAGIAFEYKKAPNGYLVKELPPEQLTDTTVTSIFIYKASEASAKTEDQLSSGITVSTFSNLSYSSSLEWAQNDVRTNFPQRQIKDYQMVTIGGVSAVRYASPRHPYMINGKPYIRQDGSIFYIDAYESVLVLHDGKGTDITLTYKDENDPSRADFEKFLTSLKFN